MTSDPPSQPGPDLDFETWARASAKLLRRPVLDRARIIHDAELEKVWKDVDARWSAALLEDIEAGHTDRADRYLELCRAELARRETATAGAVSATELLPSPSTPPPPASEVTDAAGLANLRQTIDSMDGKELADAVAATSQALAWPLEKYAWLCAELSHAPAQAEHVWALHGLDNEQAQVAVREGWQQRLQSDAALAAEHQRLVEHFLQVLRG